MLTGGGSAGAAIAGSTLLGIRNAMYGMQLKPSLQSRGLRLLSAAQLTIDETTAVATAQSEPAARRLGFWITGISIYIGWNLATLLGALLGNAIGDPRQYGLDAAVAGAFLALLWPRLQRRESAAVAVAGAVVATVVAPAAPVGLPVVIAALVALVAG